MELNKFENYKIELIIVSSICISWTIGFIMGNLN